MKKTILLLLMLCFVVTMQAQCTDYVSIPDANFKAALVTNTTINTDSDTEISCTEATDYVGTIDVSDLSITNLTGIEAFVNITQLECKNNLLTSLDVSKNTALLWLGCRSNSLTTIDVSHNIKLTGLSCASNAIASLDVSNNTNLISLYCYDTAVENIDVSNNNVLEALYFDENPLLTSLNIANGNNVIITDFDVTDAPNLTCIEVDDVTYANANWTLFKDATASFSTDCPPVCYVSIPDANFKAALVADTTINTDSDAEISCTEAIAFTGVIDVERMSITDLTGIEAFVNITELYCNLNTLASIDISNNTALMYLDCSENVIVSIDVSNNASLIDLRCYSNNLSSLNILNNTLLEELRFDNNALTSLNLSNNTALSSLHCHSNSLNNIDVSDNTNLEYFYCSNNELTSLDVSNNSLLIRFQCDENNLESLNVANGNNTSLTSFIATDNPNLSCIQVDDVDYANTNWLENKDETASYSENCSATASVVDTEFNNSLSIYPNPIENSLNMSLNTGTALKKAEVYNILGKKVLSTTTTHLNTSSLSSGLYLLKITSTGNKVGVKKFIKK